MKPTCLFRLIFMMIILVICSCSTTKRTASYPIIFKLKHETYASRIKSPPKIHDPDAGKAMHNNTAKQKLTVRNDPLTPEKKVPAVIRHTPELQSPSVTELPGSSHDDPAIASLNSDYLLSTHASRVHDQYFQKYNGSYQDDYDESNHFIKGKKYRDSFEGNVSSREEGKGKGSWIGLVALIAGMLGIVCLFSSFIFPILFLPTLMLICALTAILFGAIGLNKSNRGYALAGLLSGAVLILFLVAVYLIAALILMSF